MSYRGKTQDINQQKQPIHTQKADKIPENHTFNKKVTALSQSLINHYYYTMMMTKKNNQKLNCKKIKEQTRNTVTN